MTEVIKVNPVHPEPEKIRAAANALRQGLLVAFPTETVYGLGANALDCSAVTRIFEAKGRPSSDPLIVHLADISWLSRVTSEISPVVLQMAAAFWPGPLTIIVRKRPEVPDLVTAGRDTVAVRLPSHPVALALLKQADVLVAAPSANRFGYTSPTRASHVLTDMNGRFDVLVDSGETPIGIESTVLDLSGLRPTILRPGGVTREQLMMILDNVEVQNLTGSGGFQKSPGQLMKHYSPHAEMVYLVDPLRKRALRFLRHIAEKEISNGRSVGLLIVDEDLPIFSGLPVQIASLGPESDLWGVAHRLYEGMRALNSRNVEIIFARDLGNRGPGLALRDRLRRAATKVIWQNKEIDTNLC